MHCHQLGWGWEATEMLLYMKKLSFNQKRILIGVWLLVSLGSLGNHYLEWGLFGNAGKKVMVGCYFVLGLLMLKWLPRRDEWDSYRRAKIDGNGDEK